MKLKSYVYRLAIRTVLNSWYAVEKIFQRNAFKNGAYRYIENPVASSGNPVKDLLFTYHVKQFHESSCSVASVASVINALLDVEGRKPESPITQHQLLDQVKAAHWKERMSEKGYNGKRGLPLDVLGEVVRESLNIFRIRHRHIDVVWADTGKTGNNSFKARLLNDLEAFNNSGACVIIAHFDQGSFLPEFHIPHISPVGGYDKQKGLVTMLDVDPDQHRPYQITFETFFKGLCFNYYNIFKPFGYACGGYILIQL